MSQPKSFAIGAFIVGAILLVFIALLFFSGGQLFSHKERVIMYFDGSVQGLQIGAPIKLKGVILGEIADIQINFPNDENSSADNRISTAVTADLALQRISRKGATVDREFFADAIGKGLRAQLNFQSFLTGLLYVELDFFPNTTPTLYNLQNKYLELPTVATEFEEISKNLQEMNVKSLIDNLDKLTLQISKLVQSGAIENTLGSVQNAANSIDKAASGLQSDVNTMRLELSKTTRTLNTLLTRLNEQTPNIAQNLNSGLLQLNQSLQQFTQTTQSIEHTFAEDSPLIYQLNRTLTDVSRSANALRNISDTLEQQPEALLRGKQNLDEE